MKVLCLDLEGVLIPEIWQAVAGHTGLDALNKTTRDIPDYDELMQFRMRVLHEHDLAFSMIRKVIDGVEPLPGAREFLDWARERHQVVIVSDTFYEFAMPLMAKFGRPTLLCHRAHIEDDRLAGYTLRQPDPKRSAVKAFQSLRMTVIAAGDSYNDVPMLEQADAGYFYRAPTNVRKEFPQYAAADSYTTLKDLIGE